MWWGGEAACCAWASASRSSVRRLVSDVLCGPCVHVVLCCLLPVLVQCSVLVKKGRESLIMDTGVLRAYL